MRVGRPGFKYAPLGRDFPLPLPKFHLFNAKQAMPTTNTQRVYIVEGEFDAISVWMSGLKAVAVPGSTQWHEPWSHLFGSAEVKIAFDGDSSGESGAHKLCSLMQKYGIDVEVVTLPDGEDVNSLWVKHGREGVRKALASA